MTAFTTPSRSIPPGASARTPRDRWTRAVTGLWIGLLTAGALGAGSEAEAGPRLAKLEPAPRPAPLAEHAPAGSGRILLAVRSGTGSALAAGETLFTLVGNRTGLASAVGVETRGGDLWLAGPAPATSSETEFARRDGPAPAFQGTSSSVASR